MKLVNSLKYSSKIWVFIFKSAKNIDPVGCNVQNCQIIVKFLMCIIASNIY